MTPRISLIALAMLFLVSCEKYRDLDNLETTENSFTGTVSLTQSSNDIHGVFTGMADSGTYGFIWDNPTKGAVLNVDALSFGGSVQFILEDSRGNEALNAFTSGESNAFSIDGKEANGKSDWCSPNLKGMVPFT